MKSYKSKCIHLAQKLATGHFSYRGSGQGIGTSLCAQVHAEQAGGQCQPRLPCASTLHHMAADDARIDSDAGECASQAAGACSEFLLNKPAGLASTCRYFKSRGDAVTAHRHDNSQPGSWPVVVIDVNIQRLWGRAFNPSILDIYSADLHWCNLGASTQDEIV